MDPLTYDKDDPQYAKDEEKADEDYFAFCEWLEAVTADELKSVKGDDMALRRTLCRYYQRGYRAHLTPDELIDFLGVSNPAILDMAGYNEDEIEAAMLISDSITDEEIMSAI